MRLEVARQMRVVTPLPNAAARPPESIHPLVLASLAQPSAYPKDASAAAGLEQIETPLSHLFLTRERVYKLRKSVDLGSADFATRRKRNTDCVREVRLNRRLAPDVYLGVAPLVQGPESFVLGALVGTSPSVLPDAAEHCVVMRRLPADRDALGLLKAGRLTTRHVAAMAERVASFHQRNRLSPRRLGRDRAILRRVTQPFRECIRALEVAHSSPEVAATLRVIDGLARAFLEARAADICRRARSRRWVDGHGDLRLSHVWFEHDRDVPAVTDCLEFDDELRYMDAASDLAFLAMDLAYRGREKLGEQLLSGYANSTDDFDLFRVIDYFQGYRALVRARVAAFGSTDSALGWDDPRAAGHSVERYLALAERMLRVAIPRIDDPALRKGRDGQEHGRGVPCRGVRRDPRLARSAAGKAGWLVLGGRSRECRRRRKSIPPIGRPRSTRPCWSALRRWWHRVVWRFWMRVSGPSLDAIAPGVGRSNTALLSS